MTPRTIPVHFLLEYLNACQPVVARVSDQIRPHDPLSTAVMPLVAALTVLERSVRRYQRHGTWEGTPVFLTVKTPDQSKIVLRLVSSRSNPRRP